MLFASYGAPAPPRGKNPLLIVLGVCGGCVVLVVIGGVIMVVAGAKMFKGIISGAIETPQTTRKFVTALQSHDWATAQAQVAPSAQSTITVEKIQAAEEQIEKKLGPVKPMSQFSTQPVTNTIPGPNGKPQYMEYVYNVPMRYEKGTATVSIHFRSDDLSSMNTSGDISKIKIPGKLTSFKITSDGE